MLFWQREASLPYSCLKTDFWDHRIGIERPRVSVRLSVYASWDESIVVAVVMTSIVNWLVGPCELTASKTTAPRAVWRTKIWLCALFFALAGAWDP